MSATIKNYLEKKLKLKVNEEKSAVAKVSERKFLGYRILNNGALSVAATTIQRAKDKIQELTWRNCSKSFEQVIEELNLFLKGWLNYFKLSEAKSLWQELDSWIKRKLRCYKLKQKKRGSTVAKMLMSLDVSEKEARQIGSSGKGWWRLSSAQAVHQALNNDWFKTQGLISLEEQWGKLLKAQVGTAVCNKACTVV